MNSLQAVTIVSSGGTPIQLADQRGAPYPTTGYGALVYNIGPHLIDVTLTNAVLGGPFKLVPGTFYDPSIQFTLTEAQTPGFYSTGPGNISLVGTDGTEASRAHLAQFNHPGDLLIPRHVYADGTIVANEDSSMLATTRWVNTNFLSNSESDALYVKKTGDTMTGPLTGTIADFSSYALFGGYHTRLVGRVQGQGTLGTIQITNWNSPATNSNLSLYRFSNSQAGPSIVLATSRTSTIGAHGAALPGDTMGTISFNASDGFWFNESASIRGRVDAAITPGTSTDLGLIPSRLEFYVTPVGGFGATEVLRINSSQTAAFSGIVTHLTPPADAVANESVTAAWVRANGGSGGAATVIGLTPPAVPTVGQLWFCSDGSEGGGQTYLWFDDGSSRQWVPVTPIPASISGAVGDFLPLTGGTLSGDLQVGDDVAKNVYLYERGWISILATEAGWAGIDMWAQNNPVNEQGWQMTIGGGGALGTGFWIQALNNAFTVQKEWKFERNGDTVLPGYLNAQYIDAKDGITISGADWPSLRINTTNGTINAKNWGIFNYAADGTLYVEATVDDDSTAQADFEFRRNGTFVTKYFNTVESGYIKTLTGTSATFSDSVSVSGSYQYNAMPVIVFDANTTNFATPTGHVRLSIGSPAAADNIYNNNAHRFRNALQNINYLTMQAGGAAFSIPLTGTTAAFSGNVTAPNIVKITISATAPSSPAINDIWIDTT
jgi:hypothetical protein